MCPAHPSRLPKATSPMWLVQPTKTMPPWTLFQQGHANVEIVVRHLILLLVLFTRIPISVFPPSTC